MRFSLLVAFIAICTTTGCSQKSVRSPERRISLSQNEVSFGATPKDTRSFSVWGVATNHPNKSNVSSSKDLLSLKARGFALQMIGLSSGAEAIISSSGISVASRGSFSSAGSAIKNETLISSENSDAVIIQMDTSGPERLPGDNALASISTLTTVFDSAVVKKSFQSRFDTALNGKIKDKMNSLGLNRCMVYLNSMDYDEREGIRAEFSLFKSNTP